MKRSVRATTMRFLVPLSIFAVLAGVISALTPVPFWAAFLMAVGAILVNGLLATLEDDLPGGFNNPTGSSTPRYAAILTQVGRWFIATVSIVFAVVAALLALKHRGTADQFLSAGFSGLFVGSALAMIRRRRGAIIAATCAALAFATFALVR